MKTIHLIFSVLVILLITSCNYGGVESSNANYNVVPLPNEVITTEGEDFILTSKTILKLILTRD